jgi:hypothetical protein
MDTGLSEQRGETTTHRRLQRLAVLWAQARGYSACAAEVSLPQCRYRADVAAYRPERTGIGSTIIFECKQTLPDLRRDNCRTSIELERLGTIQKRRETLEKHLRVHYPSLRNGDSLFPEFASHDFAAIGHRTYTRVIRELTTLQNRLYGGTKFERLLRYRCANLFFLVLPNELVREPELPFSWGVLIESKNNLTLLRKPVWYETTPESRARFLHRIAMAGTRNLNREFEISFDEVQRARQDAI